MIVTTQKKYATNNTLFLALTVLFLSLSNLQYWFLDTSFIEKYPFIKNIYIPFHWLVLPMFYLYVYNFLGKESITLKRKIFLIAPFFLVLLIHILQVLYKYFVNNSYEIPSHFSRGIFVYLEFFSFIFNVLVMYFTFQMITSYEKDKSYNLKWVKSETNWLKKLIYTGLIVCLCWFIALLIVVIYNLDKSYFFYPMWIGISVLVYWIGYVGLGKSTQLRKRIELRKKRIIDFGSKTSKTKNPPNSKTFEFINQELKEKKLYLNPNLTLKLLSEELELSEGYISQLVNKNSGFNFNDYVNSLRIEDAEAMLKNKEYDNYTITAIGLESGFNSKSSFYAAFKKFTDKTPTEYKKSVRNL